MVTQWYSEQAAVAIGVAGTIVTNTTLDNCITETAFTGEIRDFSITGGERDLETIKLLGYNEIRDLKRATPISASFTVNATDHDWLEFWLGPRKVMTAPADSFYRMRGGEKTTFATGTQYYGQRAAQAILFTLTDGTNTVRILMNNVYFVNVEQSLSADATMELSVTAKCLASEFYYEDDFA